MINGSDNIHALPHIRPKVKPTENPVPKDLRKNLAALGRLFEHVARRTIGEHAGSGFVALDPEVAGPLESGMLASKPIAVTVILLPQGGSVQTIEPRWDWPI